MGISLEAFRAKKVKRDEKKLKKNVAKVGELDEISRAEKNLAAIVKFGGVALEKIEPVSGLNEDELSLIYDETYAKMDKAQREKEAGNLAAIVKRERAKKEREELSEEIRIAEEAGDDAKVDELLRKMQALNLGKN